MDEIQTFPPCVTTSEAQEKVEVKVDVDHETKGVSTETKQVKSSSMVSLTLRSAPPEDGCSSCLRKFRNLKSIKRLSDTKSYCFCGMRALVRGVSDLLLSAENVNSKIFSKKYRSQHAIHGSDPEITD